MYAHSKPVDFSYDPSEIPSRFWPEGGERIGHYIVEKQIGEGTYGLVFKTTNSNDSTVKAVKLLKLWEVPHEKDRELITRRFKGEFLCGQVDSEYLVHSFDFGKIKGNPYIVMDYLPNKDLREHLNRFQKNEFADRLAHEILHGLKALHCEGIMHRDLKPENILFSHDFKAHLTDFGIAGFLNARMTVPNILGRVHETFGTYAYIAPEQLKDNKKFNATSPVTDIFSFGVMMYEVLSGGAYPFGSLNSHAELADYIMKSAAGRYDSIKKHNHQVSEKWEKIIARCLEPDYHKRFQKVDDVLSVLGNTHILSPMIAWNFHQNSIALEVMMGEDHGRVYDLSELLPDPDGILTIGSTYFGVHPGRNHIEITENQTNYISNFHATIMKSGFKEGWFIKDGQQRIKNNITGWFPSTNGLLVNSKKSGNEWFPIQPGDILTLGDTTLKVIVTS